MKKALVSLAVGDRCYGPWSQYLHANWSAWCRRHGYDLILFDSLLDTTSLGLQRSPAWQKLLAMSSPTLQAYDRAFWLDADVLICPDAEDPIEYESSHLISMVRDVGSPLAYEPPWFKHQWSRILCSSLLRNHGTKINLTTFADPDHFSYFHLWGFNPLKFPLFNTGLIAFNPASHSPIFSEIYYRWQDGGAGALYEMIPLNLELFQRGLINEIPVSFNQLAGVQHAVWSFYPHQVQSMHGIPSGDRVSVNGFFEKLMSNSSFLHFAGAHQLMIDFLKHCQLDSLLRNSLNLTEAY